MVGVRGGDEGGLIQSGNEGGKAMKGGFSMQKNPHSLEVVRSCVA